MDCHNGGECVEEAGVYRCRCPAGYTSDLCEQEVDECRSNPCIHGNCSDDFNSYSCDCPSGYTGDNCGSNIDECESNPCFLGNCTDMINKYICSCFLGAHGSNCQGNCKIHSSTRDVIYAILSVHKNMVTVG